MMKENEKKKEDNQPANITGKKVVSNMIWRFLERFGAYIVSFIVSLVLARIFADNRGVYGSIAVVTAITAILQVFVDSGLGNALIQKKDADNIDFSSVFWFNIVVCLVLYTALFFFAPLISKGYKGEDLTWVIRILGLTVVISGVKNVLQAYVSRNLMFKKFFFATLGGTIAAAVVGIVMALNGFGVWALVAQHLVNLAIDTLIIWLTVKWKPQFVFSFDRFKCLFKYGYKLLLSALLDTGYKELRTFIIGFRYSDLDLADYNRGKQFPEVVVNNVNTAIDSVLLPTMSKVQNDKEKVREMTRKSIKISTYIMMPMMVGLAVCAKPIVSLILTDAWLDCVPYLQIFCITFAFYPIHTANLNAIKAMGRSDLFLLLEVIKKALGIGAIVAAMFFGPLWLAIVGIPLSICSQIINSFPNRKLLNYKYERQILDMLPQMLLAIFMGGCVFAFGLIPMNKVILLICQIILGIIIYIGGSLVFKLDSLNYLRKVGKTLFSKKA